MSDDYDGEYDLKRFPGTCCPEPGCDYQSHDGVKCANCGILCSKCGRLDYDENGEKKIA